MYVSNTSIRLYQNLSTDEVVVVPITAGIQLILSTFPWEYRLWEYSRILPITIVITAVYHRPHPRVTL